MKQLPSYILRMLVAASVAAALILGPHSVHTQVADTTTTSEDPSANTPDVAKPARPKVKYDGTLDVAGVNYGIPYYFQEGKDYEHEDAHVYYAPAFHLTVDDDLLIRHHVDEDNESLTLYFQRAANSKDIVTALREKLITAAKEDISNSTPIKGERKYRIEPLLPDYIVFRSTKKYRRKNGEKKRERFISEQVRGVATQSGSFTVTFYNLPRDQSEIFVDELQKDIVQIEFQYIFAGVSDETCIAKSEDRLDQSIDLFKKVVGEGREGYVSRNQVVNIADQIVKGNYFSVRCADFATAADLMKDLVAMLGKAKEVDIADWDKLDDLVAFDVDSFKADVTDSLDEISNETVRDTLESAMANASSDSRSIRFGFGREAKMAGDFFGIITGSFAEALNVQYGNAKSEAKSKAARIYSDFFKEKGVSIDWDGTKFIPKSVDVHTVADLRTKWGRSIEIKYSITKSAEGQNWMRLTESDRSELISRQELDTFRREIEAVVSMTREDIRDIRRKTRKIQRSVRNNNNSIESISDSVLSESYEFRLDGERNSDYLTSVKAGFDGGYPVASIASWNTEHSCRDSSVRAPFLRAIRRTNGKQWSIVFDEGIASCRWLYVHVIYWPSSLMKNTHYVYADERTKGGTLTGGKRDD